MSVLKSRKARAILAGGVVLGVGATMTLAAWSDSEWATGTFGTGGFTFQGSTDGTAFSEHATPATAATLSFTLDASDLTPGASVEATYWVKAVGQDADVTITHAAISESADTALVNALAVEFFNAATCGTAGGGLASGALGITGAPAREAEDGEALPTCIRVTLDEDFTTSTATTTGAVAWEFAAETA